MVSRPTPQIGKDFFRTLGSAETPQKVTQMTPDIAFGGLTHTNPVDNMVELLNPPLLSEWFEVSVGRQFLVFSLEIIPKDAN